MTGQRRYICGNTQRTDKTAKFHHIPATDQERRATWKQLFEISKDDIRPSTHIYSRHFPNGDRTKMPSLYFCTAKSSLPIPC